MVVGVGAVVLASAGVVGAHGGDARKVHACVEQGLPRILDDPAQACPDGSRALDWNIEGPQGPPGASGPAGPQGPAGGTAAPSTDVVRVVSKRSKFDLRSDKVVIAACPGGSALLSGGYEIDGQNSTRDAILSRPARLNGTRPSGDAPPQAWIARTSMDLNDKLIGDTRFRLIAYAVCQGPAGAFDQTIAPPVGRPR